MFRLGTVFYSFSEEPGFFARLIVILFFLAELFIVLNALAYFVNIISSTFFYERKDEAWRKVHMKRPPAVTVFIPMRNEPLKVVRKTIIAARYIDYPNYEVVVVDSSDSPHYKKIRQLAKMFGVTYYVTPHPRHGAKAGALNDALRVFNTPYFVVFDSDYRSSRDFLKMLVPQMEEDKQLAFIQTPQFYGNHTDSPISRIAQIQQSIFYEYISEGKSLHNGMFLCGTNAIVRRQALEDVGWWDEDSVTEDFSTSINMVAQGWKTKYYNHIMAFGDGPSSLAQYIKQQYRWARGTFGAYFDNINLFLNPFSSATFLQRVEFTLSGVYFMVGIVWLFLMFMPIFYIFFRVPAYKSDPLLFTIAYFPYVFLSFLFYALTMRVRKIKVTDLLKAQSLTLNILPVYIKALFDATFGRRAVFEKVNKSSVEQEIPWGKLKIQLFMIGASVMAFLYGLYSYPDAYNKPALASNIFWALFHSVIMSYFLISLYVAKEKNVRT
ncbi:glycosyltransferase [Patescibacteria group bacterium]|nr:glycosyltransferase [Patescibacteria group bacterium]